MIIKEKKIILLLPAKTGTNSLKKCFIESGLNFDTPINKPNYPIYHSTLSEIIEIYDINKDTLKDYKILHFVRNPYERFISSWIHQSEIMGWHNFKLDNIISMVEKNKNLVRYKTDEFYENFYGSIDYKNKFYENNNWGGLRFWWEQNWWNDLNLSIKLFKLEDIEISTNNISQYIDYELINLPNIRPNIRKKEIFDYSIYKKDYGSRIYMLYKNDFVKYNYEF